MQVHLSRHAGAETMSERYDWRDRVAERFAAAPPEVPQPDEPTRDVRTFKRMVDELISWTPRSKTPEQFDEARRNLVSFYQSLSSELSRTQERIKDLERRRHETMSDKPWIPETLPEGSGDRDPMFNYRESLLGPIPHLFSCPSNDSGDDTHCDCPKRQPAASLPSVAPKMSDAELIEAFEMDNPDFAAALSAATMRLQGYPPAAITEIESLRSQLDEVTRERNARTS
jgi:hypothetical protein